MHRGTGSLSAGVQPRHHLVLAVDVPQNLRKETRFPRAVCTGHLPYSRGGKEAVKTRPSLPPPPRPAQVKASQSHSHPAGPRPPPEVPGTQEGHSRWKNFQLRGRGPGSSSDLSSQPLAARGPGIKWRRALCKPQPPKGPRREDTRFTGYRTRSGRKVTNNWRDGKWPLPLFTKEGFIN